MKTLWIIVGTIGCLAIVFFVSALSGTYNISAKTPHWALSSYVLETVRDRSISRHSASVALPDLNKPDMALKGVIHFNETCWKCHGAPGRNPEEFADGLYPIAPPLESTPSNMNPKEIFWTIDNGIKFTGMPSFGITHTKEEIADMVAFIEKLPTLDAQRYKKLVDEATMRYGEDGHPHGAVSSPGAPATAPQTAVPGGEVQQP